MGAWIETCKKSINSCPAKVAPRVGAWIETESKVIVGGKGWANDKAVCTPVCPLAFFGISGMQYFLLKLIISYLQGKSLV